MEERGIFLAGFCETKVFGEDLSRGHWRWIPGPESLPGMGEDTPRMGLGVMVDDRIHPDATLDSAGKYSMWVRVTVSSTLVLSTVNARCGMNGDPVTNTAGRRLGLLCKRHEVSIVNGLDLATGKFTRKQWIL